MLFLLNFVSRNVCDLLSNIQPILTRGCLALCLVTAATATTAATSRDFHVCKQFIIKG